MTINFLDLKKQYNTLDIPNLMKGIEDIITNGKFVGGEALTTFETNFANYNGTKYAVGVGSGTDALIFALAGLGVGPGDEVIVPANTFIATALAVTHVGATPVFVDVNPLTYLVTSDIISKAITNKTKAIIPVHLYGNTVFMPDIINLSRKHNLFVIEDCAQAIGASVLGEKVGTWGDAGCFSFYPAKNLGGLGQGGAIITSNKSIVDKAMCLGNVGRKEGSWYEYSDVGYNSRLDAVNALFLNTCLSHIDTWNVNRLKVAKRYEKNFSKCSTVSTPFIDKGCTHVYHLYEIKVTSKTIRDDLQIFLKDNGIFSALHYPVPCHKQEVYSEYNNLTFGTTESLSDTLLSIPMHPFLTNDEIDFICEKIIQYLK